MDCRNVSTGTHTRALLIALLLLAAIFSPGCSGCAGDRAPTAQEIAGFEVANVAAAQVDEVLRGDGKVYLHIREAQWTFWVMAPAMAVQPGDHVLLGRGQQRVRYESPELKRSFDAVIETAEVKVVSAEESARLVRLPPPEGGVDIQGLYAQQQALAGKPVILRGRVVKASKNIFDTNWYHLQDGTGAEGTDDLTVTSAAQAEVGDVVLVQGALTLDHDLGFGYRYDAILLDAALTVEQASGAPVVASAGPPPGVLPAAPTPAQAPAAAQASAPGAAKPPGIQPPERDWDALIAAQMKQDQGEAQGEAPTRVVLGLTLGESDDAAITRWLAERGIACAGVASERRKAVRYDCKPAQSALTERPAQGQLAQLLLTRADEGPLEHLLLMHRYSVPAAAVGDYTQRAELLTQLLGAPRTRQEPPAGGELAGRIVRYVTAWQFEALKVEVVLMKIQDSIQIVERWNLQQDTARFAMRPGAKGSHGSVKSSPNPHLRAAAP